MSELRAALGGDGIHRVSLQKIKSSQQGILMNCPHCGSTTTAQLVAKTSLGYRTFRCRRCVRKFNERTGTQYNHLQFPTDIVMLVVLWRLRYKGYTACGIWPRCSWCAGLPLHMKQYGIGRSALPRSSPNNYAQGGEAKVAVRGTPTKHTLRSRAIGVICVKGGLLLTQLGGEN